VNFSRAPQTGGKTICVIHSGDGDIKNTSFPDRCFELKQSISIKRVDLLRKCLNIKGSVFDAKIGVFIIAPKI